MSRTVCGICEMDECRCKTHPGYVIGSHWLETAYSRVCAGENEAEVLADYGWGRDIEALRRDAERLQADVERWRETLGAAIALGEKNMDEIERLQVALTEAEAVREACNQRAFRLEAEIERLREALRAETDRCAKVCEDYAQRCRDAGWDSEAAILRDAAKTMQE